MAVEKLQFQIDAVGNAVPQLKQVSQQLGRVDSQVRKSTRGLQQYANTNRALRRNSMSTTRGLGALSLQLQDVGVQASMGTDALRIMTQQGPQIASIFGTKGMIIGGLIAVGGAIATLSKSTTKLTFDFQKFGKDVGPAFAGIKEMFAPVAEFMGKAFDFIKDAAITGINFIINGFLKLTAAIGAIPDAVGIMADNVQTRFNIMRNKMQMILKGFQVFFNEMVRFLQGTFFRFVNFLSEKTEGLFNGLIEQANKLRDKFGMEPIELRLDLPELDETGGVLSDRINELNGDISALATANEALIAALKANGVGFDAIKEAMDRVKNVDIVDYFGRTKKAVEGASDTLTDAQKRTQAIAQTVQSSMGNALMSLVDRTTSVKDAFKQMAADIIRQLYNVLIVQRMVNAAMGMLGFSQGAAGTPGAGQFVNFTNPFGRRANGGPVSAGKPYLVGERGPELMIPGKSGTVVPNNELGGVTVNQTFNFAANGDDSVKQIIAQAAPQIANMTQQAIIDARRRGGQVKQAFG